MEPPTPNAQWELGFKNLDERLRDLWNLGRDMILGWCPDGSVIDVVTVPYYEFLRLPEYLEDLPLNRRQLEPKQLRNISGIPGAVVTRVKLPPAFPRDTAAWMQIDGLVKRYSITQERGRAVTLFDIVGFSLLSPREQIVQLNSLAYSINSAHRRLIQEGIDVKFARSTTGDGFYVWNREDGIQSNANVYHLMHLALADNAIARLKATSKSAPLLKSAFLIGDYYNIFRTEGLSPALDNFVVGSATIELSRIIDAAFPGQILLGDFRALMPLSSDPDVGLAPIEPVEFVNRLQPSLSQLTRIRLSGERINEVRCYLTGDQVGDSFTIKRRRIIDKHGLGRDVYNAKVNIYLKSGEPIYLGLQEADLRALEKRP